MNEAEVILDDDLALVGPSASSTAAPGVS